MPVKKRDSHRWIRAGAAAVLGVATLALLAWLVVVPAARVQAADFTVNVATDDADLAIDGVCDSAGAAGNQCSLRAAIEEANANGAPDTIAVSVVGPIVLGAPLPAITDDDLAITGSGQVVDLTAAGPAITVDANRVQVSNLVLDGGAVGSIGVRLAGGTQDATLTDLTIRDFTGDGIFQIGSAGPNTIQGSTITSNGDDGIDWGGGHDARILENTITNNTDDGLETGAADGMLLQGNTFSGNGANQINILALNVGEDIDIFQNNITSTSDGIRIGAGVGGGDIAIGVTVPNRNVFRGALAPGEFHVLNASSVNVNAENNDWDAYSVGAIEGVVCHSQPDSDANCAGEGTGVVDFDPFIASPMPLPTATPPTTPTPTATPTPEPTATPTGGATETVTLAPGCNFIASTYGDGTVPIDIAGAVMPAEGLTGLWAQQPPPIWRGYSPLFPEVSDMEPVDRLDVVAICMEGSGTFTRPVI